MAPFSRVEYDQPSSIDTRKQLTRPAQATGVHAHTLRYIVHCHSKELIFDLAPVVCAGSENCTGLFPHTLWSTYTGKELIFDLAPVVCAGSENCTGLFPHTLWSTYTGGLAQVDLSAGP
ncbi:hypothetical protein QE152_g18093 [Popillia japonica]|uniref:Uncharacterized protein n=1 Tax=Popillia japonica TaxID=7064 RepID=A0AAW1L3M3_POPJA